MASEAAGGGLGRFSALTRGWFEGAFAAPTQAQVGAWDALASDQDVLVVAPTGSGKTLAALLSAIERLAAAPPPPRAGRPAPPGPSPSPPSGPSPPPPSPTPGPSGRAWGGRRPPWPCR